MESYSMWLLCLASFTWHMFSRFVHSVAQSVLISFFWMNTIPLCRYTFTHLFIIWWIYGLFPFWLSCTMLPWTHTYIQVFMWLFSFLIRVTNLNSLRYSQTTFKVAAPFYITVSNVWGSQFLHILTNLLLVLFKIIGILGCKIVSCCCSALHLHNGQWCWTSLHVLTGHLYFFG